jgi:CDP-4-dehydro-6-deoxyglucose reductase
MAQTGELQTFDGHVDLAEVLRAFPDARFEDDAELKRVTEIMEAALHKPAAPTALPDAEVLMGRLEGLGRDFARVEAELRHLKQVTHWMTQRVSDLVVDGALPEAPGRALLSWFRREVEAMPGDTGRWQKLVTRERLMRVMSAQVTVLPRGLAFDCQGKETLLEAGLRAGLSFAYGCSNGNCGECRARVVSGEVVKVRPHDVVISEGDKARGVTLMCCYAAVSDVTLEAALASADEIPVQRLSARVRQIEPLGDGVVALHLLTSKAERFRFLAGQKLRAAIEGSAAELYVASCPCEERRIELHVGRDSSSAFANHVVEQLRSNEEIEIAGPYGQFVLDETSERPLLLIAEGIGYAPIKSLLQHALSLDRAPAITLVRAADRNGLYQENLPRSYASALDNFTYLPFAAGQVGAAFDALAARPDLATGDVYAAGSTTFLDALRTRLLAAGMAAERWHGESVDREPARD